MNGHTDIMETGVVGHCAFEGTASKVFPTSLHSSR